MLNLNFVCPSTATNFALISSLVRSKVQWIKVRTCSIYDTWYERKTWKVIMVMCKQHDIKNHYIVSKIFEIIKRGLNSKWLLNWRYQMKVWKCNRKGLHFCIMDCCKQCWWGETVWNFFYSTISLYWWE